MDFVALDVETTGTISYVDHIVEVAAIRFSGGKVVETFTSLIDPGVSMPPAASRVNGITDDMLKEGPKAQEVLKKFSKFCRGDFLVAHNAIFDFQFLAAALEKNHCSPPTGSLFDTYALSKKLFTGLSNYKLSTLVDYLKIPISQFHRAEADAQACGYLFKHILNKISEPFDFNKITGRKELRFPALKAHQFSLFD